MGCDSQVVNFWHCCLDEPAQTFNVFLFIYILIFCPGGPVLLITDKSLSEAG